MDTETTPPQTIDLCLKDTIQSYPRSPPPSNRNSSSRAQGFGAAPLPDNAQSDSSQGYVQMMSSMDATALIQWIKEHGAIVDHPESALTMLTATDMRRRRSTKGYHHGDKFLHVSETRSYERRPTRESRTPSPYNTEFERRMHKSTQSGRKEDDLGPNERFAQTLHKEHEHVMEERGERKKQNNEKKIMDLSRPTYIKVHRKHLSRNTLDAYHLPWEYDDVSTILNQISLRPILKFVSETRTTSSSNNGSQNTIKISCSNTRKSSVNIKCPTK